MKTFYIQLDSDNIIRDIIEYPHEGYREIEAELPLPIGVYGGWWKWENEEFVEYPELKPAGSLTELEKEDLLLRLEALEGELKKQNPGFQVPDPPKGLERQEATKQP